MNLLREYIRELLTEDPMGFVHDLAAADDEFGEGGGDVPFFGGDPGKSGGKAIKRAFNANADHKWLSTLDTVHWTQDIYSIENLIGKGKDELSATMSLPSEEFRSIGGSTGLWVKGRITLAVNNHDELYSGHFYDYMKDAIRDPDSEEGKKQAHRSRSSGVNKRPTVSKDYSRYGKLKRGNEFAEKVVRKIPYVLDQSTWNPADINEALVDNWKAVGIVIHGIADDGVGDHLQSMNYVEGTEESIEEFALGKTKKVMLLALELGLPIFNEDREELWSPLWT